MHLVAHRETATNRRLAEAFERIGLPCAITPPSALRAASRGDVVLTRLDVIRTLDGIEPGLDEVAAAAARGVRVLNPPAAIVAGHDKLVTARCLRQARVAHPWTTHVFGETPPLVPLPLVLKPRFGSWGEGVHRCTTRAESEHRFRELGARGWALRQGILVQELVETTSSDLRVVVAGGRIVGATERVAAPGEWRTNVALGGMRRTARITAEAGAIALAAAAAVGADLVGVDLLSRRGGGWTVIEVNAAVDFTAAYALGGRDPFIAAAAALAASASRESSSAACSSLSSLSG